MRQALCLLLATAAWAQPHCVVGGVITDSATGKAVAGVKVFLAPRSPESLPAILDRTNDEGAFCFPRVEAGDYVLRTQRAGYLDAEYGHGLTLAVRRGAGIEPLAMRLVRRSILSGTVRDSDGEPLAGVEVSIYRRLRTHDDAEPDDVESQQTDDRGVFRFIDLPAGTYYLGANHRDAALGRYDRFVDAEQKSAQEGYSETFYAAAARFADASPIVLQSGKDIAGLLVTMRKVRFLHIAGKVVGTPQGASVTIRSPNGNTVGRPIGGNEEFYFGGFEPGVYSVELRSGNQILGRKEVPLTTSDIDGLTLTADQNPLPMLTVALEYRTEGTGQAYRPPTNALTFLQRTGSEGGSIARPNANGALQFQNVEPGLYTLITFGPDEDYYVKRILLGGRPLTGRTVDLRNGDPGGLQIVMGRKTSSLSGRIAGEGTLSQAVTLLLIDESRERTVMQANADQNREFHMERLAAGNYRLYAVEHFDSAEWDAELAKALRPKSVAVELTDGEATKVELPLINAQDVAAAVK